MRALIQQFAAAKQAHIRAATLTEYLRLLRPFNNQPADLTRRQIASLIEPMSRGTGSHTLGALSILFKWAVSTGRLDADPTAGLKKAPTRQRERVLSVTELHNLWRATYTDCQYSRIVRLLILTGCRAREIGDLQWSEVQGDKLVLPGTRTKNHRQHLVPLAPLAQESLPRRRPSYPYVFGNRRHSGFSGWSKAKLDLDRRSGVTGWVHHDLRRSYVTLASELDLAPVDVIELAVNHASGCRAGVAGCYQRATKWQQRVDLAGKMAALFEDRPCLPTGTCNSCNL